MTKICPQCDKEFTTKHKHVTHCSNICYGMSKRTHDYNKICHKCNNTFTSKRKEQIFCSNKCRGENSTKQKEYHCLKCDKPFVRLKSKRSDNLYCSQLCYREHSKGEIVTKNCSTCGKEVNRPISMFKSDIVYCSVECTRKTSSQICISCGVEFCAIQYRKANNIKGFTVVRPKRNTCSYKCIIDNFKNNEARKDKISKAVTGENHPNYVNGASFNQRIRKTEKKENFGERDKRELLVKFDNKCFKCGGGDTLTVDHHVPFSRGGRLTFTNSVILCRSCNSKKNAKMPSDFYSDKELNKLKQLGIDQQSLFNY